MPKQLASEGRNPRKEGMKQLRKEEPGKSVIKSYFNPYMYRGDGEVPREKQQIEGKRN